MSQSLPQLVFDLPEIYQAIYGHPEMSQSTSRPVSIASTKSPKSTTCSPGNWAARCACSTWAALKAFSA